MRTFPENSMRSPVRLAAFLLISLLIACGSSSSSTHDGGALVTDGGSTDGGSCAPGDECYPVGGNTAPCRANEENCFVFTTPSGGTFNSRCSRNLISWHFEGALYNPKELYYFCNQEMPQDAGTEYKFYTFKIYFPGARVGAFTSAQLQSSFFNGAAATLVGFNAAQNLELELDDSSVTTPVFDVTLNEWDATTRAFKFTADIQFTKGTNTIRAKGIGKGTAELK